MRKKIESSIESKLKKEVEKAVPGARCMKWVCPGYTGVPDRIILLPGGKIAFVETKAPGKHERARQVYVQDFLRRLGFTVFSSVSCVAQTAEVIAWCRVQTCECHEWECAGIMQSVSGTYFMMRCKKCGATENRMFVPKGPYRVGYDPGAPGGDRG